MTARGMLTVVGTAVGGLIGWSDTRPTADPESLRSLFADFGVQVGPAPADLAEAVRAVQSRLGLEADGEAGPETVHLLARYAAEARALTAFRDAA
ncbi:peptidoglycan-binding domain-containing protein [Actinoplanes oblitus]|uniref:Peptidoglycan-binding domain-containing protein n=1 Tax=Actinoplanes oblitus TaxID=3040509 RepID=A0ABY8WQS2_9ACTN|nr:peptidoglycan-binding domain-containing protein [Actinoplanes oblitus]WIM99162.1 peptidoglycan-binding domain-containing protein [Actinoplanes oblitus]